jgi:hypothetical protein
MLDFIDKQTAWYYEKEVRANNIKRIALCLQTSLLVNTITYPLAMSNEQRMATTNTHLQICELYGMLYHYTKGSISKKIETGKIKPPKHIDHPKMFKQYAQGAFSLPVHATIKRGETDLTGYQKQFEAYKKFGQRESLSQHLERVKHTAQTTPNILKK